MPLIGSACAPAATSAPCGLRWEQHGGAFAEPCRPSVHGERSGAEHRGAPADDPFVRFPYRVGPEISRVPVHGRMRSSSRSAAASATRCQRATCSPAGRSIEEHDVQASRPSAENRSGRNGSSWLVDGPGSASTHARSSRRKHNVSIVSPVRLPRRATATAARSDRTSRSSRSQRCRRLSGGASLIDPRTRASTAAAVASRRHASTRSASTVRMVSDATPATGMPSERFNAPARSGGRRKRATCRRIQDGGTDRTPPR